MKPSTHAHRAAKIIRDAIATSATLSSEGLAEIVQAAIDAARPKVIVTLSDGGLPTVYSTDKALDVEIVDDACCDDLDKHLANEARETEIAAEVKAGTLFEVA